MQFYNMIEHDAGIVVYEQEPEEQPGRGACCEPPGSSCDNVPATREAEAAPQGGKAPVIRGWICEQGCGFRDPSFEVVARHEQHCQYMDAKQEQGRVQQSSTFKQRATHGDVLSLLQKLLQEKRAYKREQEREQEKDGEDEDLLELD